MQGMDGNIGRGINLRRMAQWTVNPQTDSRHLIHLPRPVRLRIYKHVLTIPPNDEGNVVIRLDDEKKDTPRQGFLVSKTSAPPDVLAAFVARRRATHSVLALLQTCRSVYIDTVGLFYSCNRLELHVPLQFDAFAVELSTPRMQALRTMAFAVPTMHDASLLMGSIVCNHKYHCLRNVIITQDGSKLRGQQALEELEQETYWLKGHAEVWYCIQNLQFQFDCGFDQGQKQKAAKLVHKFMSNMPGDDLRMRWRAVMTARQQNERVELRREFNTTTV